MGGLYGSGRTANPTSKQLAQRRTKSRPATMRLCDVTLSTPLIVVRHGSGTVDWEGTLWYSDFIYNNCHVARKQIERNNDNKLTVAANSNFL